MERTGGDDDNNDGVDDDYDDDDYGDDDDDDDDEDGNDNDNYDLSMFIIKIVLSQNQKNRKSRRPDTVGHAGSP